MVSQIKGLSIDITKRDLVRVTLEVLRPVEDVNKMLLFLAFRLYLWEIMTSTLRKMRKHTDKVC